MASRYTEVLLVVVPAARQAAARSAFRQVEAGDVLPGNETPDDARLFARGLSALGTGPATHLGIGPKVTAGMIARLAAQIEPLAGVRWARLTNPEWTLAATNAPGAPAVGMPVDWESFLPLLGLRFVEE